MKGPCIFKTCMFCLSSQTECGCQFTSKLEGMFKDMTVSGGINDEFKNKVRAVSIFTVCLFVGCLTSQQHASVSQGQICSDNFMCCHTEIEVADQTFQLTQSQYTDTGLTSPSTDPIAPGAWQGSHWSANF